MSHKPTFPQVFEKGEQNYSHDKEGKCSAIADGLSGWALCMSGNKQPEKFGQGMAAIAVFLGISALPENLSKLADEMLISL